MLHTPPINVGLSEQQRAGLARGLSHLLADSYTLYLMAHNFHWNVTGPMFASLHAMFMDQYTEQWNALDTIAERIRSLGYPVPATYRMLGELTSVQEVSGVPRAMAMVDHLIAAHEQVARTARQLAPLAEAAEDLSSADLLTQRLNAHEKAIWMLRSLHEDQGE